MVKVHYCETCAELVGIERDPDTGCWRCTSCKGTDIYEVELEIKTMVPKR